MIERRSVGAAFAEHAQGRVRRMRRQVDRYLRRFLAELDRWGGMLEVEALRQRVRDRRARQTPRAPVRSAPRRVDAARARWILHALPRYLEQSGRRWLEGRAAETLEQSRRWTHKHRGQAPDRARRLRERGGLSGLTASRDEQRREHARAAREARRERTSRRYSHAGRHRGQR